MFYAAWEQTISAADHHHRHHHHHHHHLPAADHHHHLPPTNDYWHNNTNPVPSYTCPYDATQRLCLAKLSDEDALQQWQLLQDDAPAPALEEAVEQDPDVPSSSSSSSSALNNHCCRLRLGPLVPLHEDDTNDIDPATTTTTAPSTSSSSSSPSSLQPPPKKRARFLVVYEQPLSDTSKPQLYQDIPVLLGPAEDAVAAPAPGDDDDDDDDDNDDDDDDNDDDNDDNDNDDDDDNVHNHSSSSSSSSCLHVLKSLIDSAVYQNDRSLLWLSAWPTREAAVRYVLSIDRTVEDRVDLVRISRDYESFSFSSSSSSSSGSGSGIGSGSGNAIGSGSGNGVVGVVGVAMSGCDGFHTSSTETALV